MPPILFSIAIGAALTALIIGTIGIIITKSPFLTQNLPYRKRTYLMHEREKYVFRMLNTAIPSGYVLFPQVVISSIAQAMGPSHIYWQYQNKINKKTLDYVVFSLPDYTPVLAIEYDGKMHNTSKRQARDTFVNDVMQAVGIPILHITHSRELDSSKIKNAMIRILHHTEESNVSYL